MSPRGSDERQTATKDKANNSSFLFSQDKTGCNTDLIYAKIRSCC